MPDAPDNNGHFEPVHAAHAIEQVVFVLQFDRPLDDVTFARVHQASDQFSQDLPGQEVTQGFAFAISGPGEMPPPVPTQGIIRRRVGPDGAIVNELRMERSAVTFITTHYTRWNEIWMNASNYFNTLLPIFAQQGARIVVIGLNFVDKFAWNGELAQSNPNLLLRARSDYLCPHVYQAQDFWHSHTGAFIRVDEFTKRLINVNVDYVDEIRNNGQKRIVAITTAISDQLNQPDYTPYNIEDQNLVEFVSRHMQSLHDYGKSILGNVITDEMSRRIALIE